MTETVEDQTITYRGVSFQFLSSSYRKKKEGEQPPNQTQQPQHRQLMELLQFYFIQLSIPYGLGE